MLDRQHADQVGVRFWKRQRAELRARHPSHFLSEHRLRVAFKFTAIEVQRDSLSGIRVCHRVHQFADDGDDVQFFVQLTAQCFGVSFGWVTLPSRKFPVRFEVAAWGPQGKEKRIRALNHRGDDDDRGRHR